MSDIKYHLFHPMEVSEWEMIEEHSPEFVQDVLALLGEMVDRPFGGEAVSALIGRLLYAAAMAACINEMDMASIRSSLETAYIAAHAALDRWLVQPEAADESPFIHHAWATPDKEPGKLPN